MANEFLAKLDDVGSLAGAIPLVLRAFHDRSSLSWEIAEHDGEVWLKATVNAPDDMNRLRRFPATLYQLTGDTLTRCGHRVPERSAEAVASMTWYRLDEIVEVELPVPHVARPIDPNSRVRLELVRGGEMVRPHGLLARLDVLRTWCETTPHSALRALRWAFDNDNRRCLILGDRLPPIEGTYLVADHRVLVPGGWTWSPRASGATVGTLFDVPPDHWLIWESDTVFSLVPDEALSVMTRASVRSA